MITEKEIRAILKGYRESYAPWEIDGGYCQNYDDDRLIEFAKQMYNRALEDAANSAEVTGEQYEPDGEEGSINLTWEVDKESILKLKI